MKNKHSEQDEDLAPGSFRRNPRNVDDPSNKIKLNKFHKIITKSKGPRKTSDKKKLRDLERFISREGLPEEIKKAKVEEVKTLKKQMKNKKEAERFELKYKKIKFIEKRKVIRNLERLDKLLKAGNDQKLQAEKEQW